MFSHCGIIKAQIQGAKMTTKEMRENLESQMDYKHLSHHNLEDLEIAHTIKERVLDKKELHFVSEEEMEKYLSKKGVFV